MAEPKTLTARQEAFVREYCVDFNGTQAAIRAGYAESGAAVEAARLLINAKISARVAAAKAALVEETQVTKAWVVRETVEQYKLASAEQSRIAARGALELLAKLHGYITEKREVRVIRNIGDMTEEELLALANEAAREDGVGKGRPH